MNIVDINKYNKKRDKKMKIVVDVKNSVENVGNDVQHLITQLEKDYVKKHSDDGMNSYYTMEEIDQIANKILSIFGINSKSTSTPIVKIAKNFDFKIGKKTLDNNLSGDIYINGDTINIYGHNKVILVNKSEQLYHQRFVVAHELAHYLFDFLGNPKYTDTNVRFSDTYFRNSHDRPEELIANRFAASILMPKDLFIEQYLLAVQVGLKDFFIIKFLSEFFETSIDSILKRIKEVIK